MVEPGSQTVREAPALSVLFAGATMVPGWGGGEPVIADLLQRGLEEHGVRVSRFGTRRGLGELARLGLVPVDADPARVDRYRRLLRRSSPDAVIAWYDFDTAMIVAARKEEIPVVSSVHIYWPTCPVGTRYIEGVGTCARPSWGKCIRHIARSEPSPNLDLPVNGLPAPIGALLYLKVMERPWTLSQADAIVANSEFMGRVLRDSGYSKVRVIPNGVDTQLFQPSVREEFDPRVLYPVARSRQERKGYPHFAEMARRIHLCRPGVRFQVLNDAADGFIEGTPFLSRPELADLMRSVYAAVVPGLWEEPFGLVAVEVMASGRPVVAYAAGGLPEVLEDGVSGELVPTGQLDELTNRVLDLLSDPARARRIGLAARARVLERFDYRMMADGYFRLIRALAG